MKYAKNKARIKTMYVALKIVEVAVDCCRHILPCST